MDHFFCSISSLMSLNLHSAVYSSINDLVQFIEMYKLGNDFTGHFERSLPVLPQPITLTVVRDHFTVSAFLEQWQMSLCHNQPEPKTCMCYCKVLFSFDFIRHLLHCSLFFQGLLFLRSVSTISLHTL